MKNRMLRRVSVLTGRFTSAWNSSGRQGGSLKRAWGQAHSPPLVGAGQAPTRVWEAGRAPFSVRPNLPEEAGLTGFSARSLRLRKTQMGVWNTWLSSQVLKHSLKAAVSLLCLPLKALKSRQHSLGRSMVLESERAEMNAPCCRLSAAETKWPSYLSPFPFYKTGVYMRLL